MDKFTLKIELGNAEMQTTSDIAEALIQVAKVMKFHNQDEGFIRDLNGNRVGTFETD